MVRADELTLGIDIDYDVLVKADKLWQSRLKVRYLVNPRAIELPRMLL